MKLSNNFFYTLREDVKNEDSTSGNLLVKSGMIRKVASGIYMYMPLGLKALEKIENIVREEMNKEGALEVLMPSLLPSEVYEKSGRKDNFGDSMFSLKDRFKRDYVLGPTHEELFVDAASQVIKSYKDMPFNIYQIANKYRDEARPRYGLIRVREFKMKDAYSFDTSLEGLEISYKKMYDAYKRIFDRVGLNYKIVKADTGVMGGLLSEEFQAITDIGEDILVTCNHCDFSSNIEICSCVDKTFENEEQEKLELVETPNAGTIEEVSKYLNLPSNKFVKTLIYQAKDKFYACLVCGDREINENKLSKLLSSDVELASKEDVEKITNAKTGFAGPIDINIPVIIDTEVLNMTNFVVGANKTGYHYKNVNISDFKYQLKADIKNVCEEDLCPNCNNKLIFKKGIEVGNTFKLGDKYSKALGLKYLDKENKEQYPLMGCYGIGIGRILASVVEQHNDEKGIIWPTQIAPFKVSIVVINPDDELQITKANELYDLLNKNNIETLLDDRKERPGVKFCDMDLIGIPIRITIGKKIEEDLVEIKYRNKDGFDLIEINKVLENVK